MLAVTVVQAFKRVLTRRRNTLLMKRSRSSWIIPQTFGIVSRAHIYVVVVVVFSCLRLKGEDICLSCSLFIHSEDFQESFIALIKLKISFES